MKLSQGIVGKAPLGAVVIHTGKQDLAGATFLSFLSPGEQAFLGGIFAAMRVHYPDISHLPGVNRQDDALRSECLYEVVDQGGRSYCRRVYAHLVCAGVQEGSDVGHGRDPTADGEGYVND